MRPVTLTLDGFRSYAAPVTFDWTGKRLVGIVGPIGAGKSSILDGICFALYGKTPTERSNIRSLIHQRADVGKVELVFEVEERRWRVVRAIRRRGQSQHALYRAGDVDEAVALGKAPVDERIAALVGLDFEGFNRSVMLAQGRFAEFLQAGPTDRDKVLKGVFGLDRIDAMETISKQRVAEAKRDLAELGRRVADLANEKELLAAAETRLADQETRHRELEGTAPAVAELDDEAAGHRRRQKDATDRLARLRDLAERLPPAGETAELLDAARLAAANVTEAGAAVVTLEAARQESMARRRTLLDDAGGAEAIQEARRAADRRSSLVAVVVREIARRNETIRRLEQARSTAKDAEQAATRAGTRAATARKAREAAERGRDEAAAALDAARHADMASTLRTELRTGDPCPVCDQPVHELPPTPAARPAGEAEAALEQATNDLRAAAAAETEAAAAAARAGEAGENAERLVAERTAAAEQAEADAVAAQAEVNATDLRLAELLGPEPLQRLHAIDQALAAIDGEASGLDDRLAAARRDAEAARVRREQLDGQVRALTGRLAELAGRLDVDAGDPDDAAMLLGAVRDAWVRRQREAGDAATEAEQKLHAIAERRGALLEGAGVDPSADFGEARAAARAAFESTQAELAIRRERLASSADLEQQILERTETLQLYEQLAKDLRPSGFLGYLLDEERAELARTGSARFEELSGGRYRFSDDGSFAVVDLAAAETLRKADTLSGGETFLASLALALALAEMVARGRGRLDAFFLDEGFGSLDAEHLDLAMTGIEGLVSGHGDRLVVIVSHVAELRERLEDLIVLDKDPATGATIVVGRSGGAVG